MNGQHLSERVYPGSTGLLVSPLGVGAWAWGDRFIWGYGRDYGESDVHGAFQASLELGINFFDTAEIYGWGRSERLLGRFIREAGQPVVVATKFMPFPWRLRRKSLLNALQSSLNRLGLSQIDLYQIHSPLSIISIETWMAGLAEAVGAGLTRAAGVSNYNVEQTRRAHAALARRNVPLASNQVEYSLLHREPEHNGLMQTCRDLNITLIAYSPLGMGLLTGKYTPDNPPKGLRGRRTSAKFLANIQPLIGLLREMGAAHGGKTPPQVALNWVMCKGALPIPGAKNARQARENAGALGWRLSEDEVAALDAESKDL
ncbi:MAG: aldo/keto reductase [Ardenticatenaceae bacterium]|nr:aldo/keto reductase [Ardenticatenaceae bacterium]HBY99469.1 2,5-didehydrogluconate reductase [Chloroflexota bacterium]